MMDFSAIMQLRQGWQTFMANHPKVPAFMANVRQKGFCENQEIAIAIRYPDGTEFKTGIRVRDTDLQLLEALKNLAQSGMNQ